MSAATAARWSRTSRQRWFRFIAKRAARMRKPASAGSTISVPTTVTCSTSGRAGSSLSLWRQFLEARHALGDRVERLHVAGEDRRLRAAIHRGIVECAGFQDNGRQSLTVGRQMGATLGTEFTRNGVLEIAAGEFFGSALGVAESLRRHQHEEIRTAARNVLALAA